jgi:hypothetical protein
VLSFETSQLSALYQDDGLFSFQVRENFVELTHKQNLACILHFASLLCAVTATVSNVPTLNGPIPVSNGVLYGKTRVGDFVHPGLWHTHDDLERIRTGVLAGKEPWKTAYAAFSNDSYSQSSVSLMID